MRSTAHRTHAPQLAARVPLAAISSAIDHSLQSPHSSPLSPICDTMEKIKNIFNPGHKQDQEILYGSPSAQRPDSPTAGTAQPQDSLNKTVEPEESCHANNTPLEATTAVSGTGTAHASDPTTGATNAEPHAGKLSTPAQSATDGISAASVRSGVTGEAPQIKRLTDSEVPAGTAETGVPIAVGSAAGLNKEPSTPLKNLHREADVPQLGTVDSNQGTETWQPDAPTPGPYIPGAFPITPQPYAQDRQLGNRDAKLDPAGQTENTVGDALYDAHRSGSGAAGVSDVPGHDIGSIQTDSDNHHARDAAAAGVVGAGVVAAASTAAHEDSGPTSKTVGKHRSNLANVPDPTVLPQPDGQKGHGAIPSTETGAGPASKTVGRHRSNIANILDPTVLPQPEKQTKHVTSGPHQSDMLNRVDPRVKSSEPKKEQTGHGQDAAVAAGVGATAAGAYTADKAHRETPQNFQNADTANAQTHQPPIIATTAGRGWHGGPTGTAVAAAANSPTHSNASPKSQRHEDASHNAQPHFEPGPAIAGGGALAGAAAVYEYEKHKSHKADHDSHGASPEQLDTSTQATSTSPQAISSPDKNYHGGGATIGGAGLAGAGVLASKHSSNPSDSSGPSATSPKSDKERSKEEKKHEKELAKEAKKREKELAKEQKKAEKEQEKILAKEEKKQHHGLLGFLHRDKHKESEGQGDQLDGTRDDVDGAGGPAPTSAEVPIVGNPTPTRISSLSGRNRLHKDPPKDFVAKAAQANGQGNGEAVHDEKHSAEYPSHGYGPGAVPPDSSHDPSGSYGYGHDYDYNSYGYGYSNEEERERALRQGGTIPNVAGSNAHTAF
ncbi:hypothetical protein IWX46DRAFT_607356 [Phyllosticta citricarpa]|uniref:Uncharacterized protein n=1 Tax=Phyllosticta citricarpa TaxID=55181 RepID=A0ABR1LZI2_9PEZI